MCGPTNALRDLDPPYVEDIERLERDAGIHETVFGLLSMAQIHAALTLYYDNQAAFDAEIQRKYEEYQQLRKEGLDSPGRRKLRGLGELP